MKAKTKKTATKPKELTKLEKDVILTAYKKGTSIKAIAKALHISDKRVLAFLRTVECKAKPTKPSKKPKFDFVKSYKMFNEVAATAASNYSREFIENLFNEFAKSSKKKDKNAMRSLLYAFERAVIGVAIATIWDMDQSHKKLWLKMAFTDVDGSITETKGNKKTK